MNIEYLNKANELREQVDELQSFIELIENGQLFDKRYNGQNEFIQISLSADIWTGSDNPNYTRNLKNSDSIKLFVNSGIETLKKLKEEKEREFRLLFN